MCCTSLRGIAFFGASIHVAVGVILFSRYVVATVVFTFYNFNNLFTEKVTAFVAPFMVYVTTLLALGVLIFHSVEKERYILLKWSSVAFSLLQLAVFLLILVLKLYPRFENQFPFLPDSFLGSAASGHNSQSSAGPEVYLAVPHGTTLEEKDLIIKPSSKSPSSDPPDPGGFNSTINSSNSTRMPNSPYSKDGGLSQSFRLVVLSVCVLMSILYMLFLFLYILQLNNEESGHVFGHAQAISRNNPPFYVQPQFSSSQQTTDNNQNQANVQRSQTQIPQQFLPQPKTSQSQSPKRVQLPTSSSTANPNIPNDDGVERSPKKVLRTPSQQSSLQLGSNFSPKRNRSNVDGCDNLQVQQVPLPILGPSPSPHHHHHHQHHHHPHQQQQQQQQQQIQSHRGPIPAQVRIGFYPQDISGSQERGVSPQNIRMRTTPHQQFNMGVAETEVVMGQRYYRGPPPPVGGQGQVQIQGQYLTQRVQFLGSDSSSSYSPNPRTIRRPGQHPISMV